MEMVDTLSDGDLRQELCTRGVNVGPITPTTRNVYRKKLARIINEADKAPSSPQQRYEQSYEQQQPQEFEVEEDNYEEDDVDFQQQEEDDVELTRVKDPRAVDTTRTIEITDGHQQMGDSLRAVTTNYTSKTPKQQREPAHVCNHTPIPSGTTYSRYYAPVDDVLRRRPLYSPSRTLPSPKNMVAPKTMPTARLHTTAKVNTTPQKETPAAGRSWLKYFVLFILLLVLFATIVYYHMDQDLLTHLPDFK